MTRVCSHFQVPAPIAARIQRTQVPFPGQARAIGRQGCQAGFVECEAGAYQVATASLTRDVVVRRWALDEQLTEDADGAGRQLKLARDHCWLSRIVAARLSGRGDRSASWPIRRHQRKRKKYGVGAWDGELQLIFRRC